MIKVTPSEWMWECDICGQAMDGYSDPYECCEIGRDHECSGPPGLVDLKYDGAA